MLGQVDGEKAVKKSETPAGKKKRTDSSPKPSSKKKSSSKHRSGELRDLDEKFFQTGGDATLKDVCCACGACEETLFSGYQWLALFYPGTSTSGLSSGVTVEGTGSSLVQTTGETAVVSGAASKSATRRVEGTEVVIQQNSTQPGEAPGAGTATQPVEAPIAGPEVLLTGTSSAALQYNSEEDLQSEPGSPADENFQYGSPDKDLNRDDSGDQEL